MIAIRYAGKLYEARRFDADVAQEIAFRVNDPRIALFHRDELIYRINTDKERRYPVNAKWILLCPYGDHINYRNVDQLRLIDKSILEVALPDSTDVFQLIPDIECHDQELKYDPPSKPYVPTIGGGVYHYAAPGIPNSTVMYAISFPSDQLEPKTTITTTTWTPEVLAEWGKNSSTELKLTPRPTTVNPKDVDAIISVTPDGSRITLTADDHTLVIDGPRFMCSTTDISSNDVVQIQNVELKGIVPPKKEDE